MVMLHLYWFSPTRQPAAPVCAQARIFPEAVRDGTVVSLRNVCAQALADTRR